MPHVLTTYKVCSLQILPPPLFFVAPLLMGSPDVKIFSLLPFPFVPFPICVLGIKQPNLLPACLWAVLTGLGRLLWGVRERIRNWEGNVEWWFRGS